MKSGKIKHCCCDIITVICYIPHPSNHLLPCLFTRSAKVLHVVLLLSLMLIHYLLFIDVNFALSPEIITVFPLILPITSPSLAVILLSVGYPPKSFPLSLPLLTIHYLPLQAAIGRQHQNSKLRRGMHGSQGDHNGHS